MKRICLLILLFCSRFLSLGQELPNRVNYPLSVGDTLNLKIPLHQLLNYSKTSAEIGDFRGKWLIIDFWATYCQGCINAMPRFETLEKKFSDRLKFLVVTQEKASHVKSLLVRSPIAKNSALTFSVEDTILKKIFPHKMIPHEIWVSPDGVVSAITSGEEVNEANIVKILGGESFYVTEKKDDLSWDYREPLGGENMDDSSTIHRSVLKAYNPNIGAVFWTHRDSTYKNYLKHVYISNATALGMFYGVYMLTTGNYGANFNRYRTIFELQDSVLLKMYQDSDNLNGSMPKSFPFGQWESKTEYRKHNLYSYDLLLNKGVSDSVFQKYVYDDLNKYFPIKGKVELRKVPCLVVKVKERSKAYATLKATSERRRFVANNYEVGVLGMGMNEFFKSMARFKSLPIVDETDISFPVDIILDFKKSKFLKSELGMVTNMEPFDLNVFDSEMNKYGLQVFKAEREIPILVIY